MNEQEITVVPVEEQISQELVKQNVTEAKIAELREKYLPLKINGIEDKENYLIVKEARKDTKQWRILAEKICKKGREEAVAIQKAWVAKEKDIAGRIGEVEDYLEKQEKEYEGLVAAEKERRKREQEEQLILRQQALTNMGVLYDQSTGSFTLGEVSFELSLVKECDADIWDSDIKPKFEEEYRKIEAERLEQERIKAEKEAELKKQQEELERRENELKAAQATLKAAQEEQERKVREEEERKEKEAAVAREAKIRARIERLTGIGFVYQFSDKTHRAYGITIPPNEITDPTDEEFEHKATDLTDRIIEKRREEEQKRLAEIEAQKEEERKRTLRQSRRSALRQYTVDEPELDLSEYTDEAWEQLLAEAKGHYEECQRKQWEKEQEEKRVQEVGKVRMEIANRYDVGSYDKSISIESLGKMDDISFEIIRDNWQAAYEKAEEGKRQLKLEAAKDKEKWDEMIAQVSKVEVYEMKSPSYRTKAKRFSELLDQIKSL